MNLRITTSPHIFPELNMMQMMKDVLIALMPAVALSLYFFRLPGLITYIVCIFSCLVTEWVIKKIKRQKNTLSDGSALVTAVLLAMIMPPALPVWMLFLSGVIAIALGKEVFGGLGHNVFNPALLSRAFLMAAFPVGLTTWNKPFTLDALTSATPLGIAKFEQVSTDFSRLFFGNVSGCLGETSALALIIGGIYLFYRKTIDYRVPAGFAGSVAVIAFLTHLVNPGLYMGPVFHLLAGGLLLGVFFMATDPVTSPVTKKGRWIFGIGCGVITMIIRLWGGLPEGVMYAILLMNAFTPIINRVTRPRRYGLQG